MAPICTVGISRLTVVEFEALLDHHRITRVVDLRHPQNKTILDLPRRIQVHRVDGLIGWPGKTKARSVYPDLATHAAEIEAGWPRRTLFEYALYTGTPRFAAAFGQLLALQKAAATSGRRLAVVCEEPLWWLCRRGNLADVVSFCGGSVEHLTSVVYRDDLARIRVQPRSVFHSLTGRSQAERARLGRYPARIVETWSALAPFGSPYSPRP